MASAPDPGVADPDVADPDAAAAKVRGASRRASQLRKQIQLASHAVDLAELRLAQVRELFRAGRCVIGDVRAAEEELFELQQSLVRTERELAAARAAAAG